MTIVNFTPGPALLGGLLVGAAVSLFLLCNGRILGITGILSGILKPAKGDLLWRAVLIGGLGFGAYAAHIAFGTPDLVETRSTAILVFGGFVTGIGARIGSGCTSGHGICGISRSSRRSIIATITFMTTGAISVYLMRTFGL